MSTSWIKRIVVLSGAGVSAESGLPTFRGDGGIWEGMDLADVATHEAWEKDYRKVLDFYNRRRAALKDAVPNAAHRLVAEMERWYDVTVVTQNIDDLHERAGSSRVVHLHGELTKARPEDVCNWDDGFSEADVEWVGYEPIRPGDTGGENRSQLRPHVVLFGEPTPMIGRAALAVREADVLVVVGTSLQVYPAASLLDEVRPDCLVYMIDPAPVQEEDDLGVYRIREKATVGMHLLLRMLGHDLTTLGVTQRWISPNGVEMTGRSFFVLDEGGRLISEVRDDNRILYEYDSRGRVARELWHAPEGTTETTFEYDLEDRCLMEHFSDIRWESDIPHVWRRAGRMEESRIGDRVRVYYRPDGLRKHRIIGWYGPAADEDFYKWDRDGQLKSLLRKYACSHVDGEPAPGKWSIRLSYDSAGRVLKETHTAIHEDFDYLYQDDERGNWIRREARSGDQGTQLVVERTIWYGLSGFDRGIDLIRDTQGLSQLSKWT